MGQNHSWPLHLNFWKTLEKLLMSMVNLRKNIQWWLFGGSKTIEKPQKQWCPGKKSLSCCLEKLPSLKSRMFSGCSLSILWVCSGCSESALGGLWLFSEFFLGVLSVLSDLHWSIDHVWKNCCGTMALSESSKSGCRKCVIAHHHWAPGGA